MHSNGDAFSLIMLTVCCWQNNNFRRRRRGGGRRSCNNLGRLPSPYTTTTTTNNTHAMLPGGRVADLREWRPAARPAAAERPPLPPAPPCPSALLGGQLVRPLIHIVVPVRPPSVRSISGGRAAARPFGWPNCATRPCCACRQTLKLLANE